MHITNCQLRFPLVERYIICGLPLIDREFEFYEFFSFLKFNEFYEFFFS